MFCLCSNSSNYPLCVRLTVSSYGRRLSRIRQTNIFYLPLSGNMWLLWVLCFLLGSALFNLSRSIMATNNHYRAAKKTGLPVVVSPVNSRNVFWLLTQKYIAPIIYRAPFGIGSWAPFTKRGWLWKYHEKVYQDLGKVWVQASPRGLDVSEILRSSKVLFIVLFWADLWLLEDLPGTDTSS